jgi:hypothetical protein
MEGINKLNTASEYVYYIMKTHFACVCLLCVFIYLACCSLFVFTRIKNIISGLTNQFEIVHENAILFVVNIIIFTADTKLFPANIIIFTTNNIAFS